MDEEGGKEGVKWSGTVDGGTRMGGGREIMWSDEVEGRVYMA